MYHEPPPVAVDCSSDSAKNSAKEYYKNDGIFKGFYIMEPVKSVQGWWRTLFIHTNKVVHLHKFTPASSDIDRCKIQRIIPVFTSYLTYDLVLLAIHNEVSEPAATY